MAFRGMRVGYCSGLLRAETTIASNHIEDIEKFLGVIEVAI